MSSHREAPEISKDPVADNTDVYAFVSPDRPDTVTLVANFIPFQNPDGGPNFYAFGTDVLYEIHVHNTPLTVAGQSPDITYQFRFTEEYKDPNSFLYNLGTVGVNPGGAAGLDTYPMLNRRQTYSVTKVEGSSSTTLAANVPVPPCNVGIHSTPNYPQYVPPALRSLGSGEGTVFAGQRADSFFADLGAVFDLADLRPLQFLHSGSMFPAPGVESFQGVNVFTIALQIPMNKLTSNGTTPGHSPADIMSPNSVIGVYAAASRPTSRIHNSDGTRTDAGPFQQVSRLGNPLFNEVLVGIANKDYWNSQSPTNDAQFEDRVLNPELAQKLPALYPLAFRNLASYNGANPHRDDLSAILLTGIPGSLNGKPVIPGFQNYTGPVQADLIRLNMAVPVAANPNGLGLLARDLQGFPNGRRLDDDVVTIELRALAGETLPLTDPTYNTDIAVYLVSDYTSNNNGGFTANFPYLATPNSGFASAPGAYAPGN